MPAGVTTAPRGLGRGLRQVAGGRPAAGPLLKITSQKKPGQTAKLPQKRGIRFLGGCTPNPRAPRRVHPPLVWQKALPAIRKREPPSTDRRNVVRGPAKRLEIKKVGVAQTAIPFGMTAQQNDLETLGHFVENCGDTS